MILDEIIETTRKRLVMEKEELSLAVLRYVADRMPAKKDFPFEAALKKEGLHFICEVKKASPSKGVIAEEFDYINIAKEYEIAGASCISVLTEPDYFLGQSSYLKEIKENVAIPVLRKDFIVDSYQIYESKILGADCILLIVSILDDKTLKEYLTLSNKLGLSALVEVHTKEEVERAILAGARIIGVNNRNLQTFEVDINTSFRLRSLIPDSILFVSESGIKTADDIKRCREHKVNAVLIGESLMKASNKISMLEILKGDNIAHSKE